MPAPVTVTFAPRNALPRESVTIAPTFRERADNTLAMGDHADHIHVGFHPAAGPVGAARSAALLEPHQRTRLIDRIDELGRPAVPRAAPE